MALLQIPRRCERLCSKRNSVKLFAWKAAEKVDMDAPRRFANGESLKLNFGQAPAAVEHVDPGPVAPLMLGALLYYLTLSICTRRSTISLYRPAASPATAIPWILNNKSSRFFSPSLLRLPQPYLWSIQPRRRLLICCSNVRGGSSLLGWAKWAVSLVKPPPRFAVLEPPPCSCIPPKRYMVTWGL